VLNGDPAPPFVLDGDPALPPNFRSMFIDVFCHPQLELAMVNLCSLPNLVEFLSLRVTKSGTATQNLENWVVSGSYMGHWKLRHSIERI